MSNSFEKPDLTNEDGRKFIADTEGNVNVEGLTEEEKSKLRAEKPRMVLGLDS